MALVLTNAGLNATKYGENMASQNTLASLLKLSITLLLLGSSLLMASRTANDELIAKILQAADLRNANAPEIQAGLISNETTVQKQAILALGRIGDPKTIKSLSAFLYSPQPEIRALTAYALAISENNQAVPFLINRLKTEKSAAVISEILPAIGLLGPNDQSPDIIAIILRYLDDENEQVVTASCDALSYAWTAHRSTISVPNSTQVYKLLKLSATDPQVANHCLYALTRIRTEAALFDAERLRETVNLLTSDYHHQLMTLILGAQNRAAFTDYFQAHFNADASPDLMALAAQAIAALPESEATKNTMTTIVEAKADYLQHHYIRIGLLDGLGQQAPTELQQTYLKKLASDRSEWVRSRAISMLYATDQVQYLPDMINLLDSDRVTTQFTVLTVANALMGDGKLALLNKAKKSKHASISEYATSILEPTENTDTTPVSKSPAYSDIRSFIDKRMTIQTNLGKVIVQLLPSAPYTSYNFYQLATTGHYNGTEFHRVIPSFVVQGGDFKNTNDDAPGYSIREELYPIRHLKGTLGMASSGKDTAGAGFYFNLKDNYHLDRGYTVFARVVSGFDVVQKLGVGDSILSVTEYQAP